MNWSLTGQKLFKSFFTYPCYRYSYNNKWFLTCSMSDEYLELFNYFVSEIISSNSIFSSVRRPLQNGQRLWKTTVTFELIVSLLRFPAAMLHNALNKLNFKEYSVKFHC